MFDELIVTAKKMEKNSKKHKKSSKCSSSLESSSACSTTRTITREDFVQCDYCSAFGHLWHDGRIHMETRESMVALASTSTAGLGALAISTSKRARGKANLLHNALIRNQKNDQWQRGYSLCVNL